MIVFPVAFQADLVNQTPIKSLEIKRNILNPFQSSHDANRFLRLTYFPLLFPFRALYPILKVESNLQFPNPPGQRHSPPPLPVVIALLGVGAVQRAPAGVIVGSAGRGSRGPGAPPDGAGRRRARPRQGQPRRGRRGGRVRLTQMD